MIHSNDEPDMPEDPRPCTIYRIWGNDLDGYTVQAWTNDNRDSGYVDEEAFWDLKDFRTLDSVLSVTGRPRHGILSDVLVYLNGERVDDITQNQVDDITQNQIDMTRSSDLAIALTRAAEMGYRHRREYKKQIGTDALRRACGVTQWCGGYTAQQSDHLRALRAAYMAGYVNGSERQGVTTVDI